MKAAPLRRPAKIASVAFATLLTGCVNVGARDHADTLARRAHLVRNVIRTRNFALTTYARLGDPSLPINFYIEGDGRAWLTPTRASGDPTPRQAIGLQLAAADPAANLVYLARPCQFTEHDSQCQATYWTDKRYSREVVESLNQAIDYYTTLNPHRGVNLAGYSGGGTLAVLVAARRRDVRSIRTVAANLDVEAVNRLHHVSPMPDSLSAIDVAAEVAGTAQVHFSGGADSVVPPIIAQRFAQAVGGSCVQSSTVAAMNHESDWARIWPELLRQEPRCGRG
jgi:dienelactone hydrolase